MAHPLLAVRPRGIVDLETTIRWLADGIRTAGRVPADCEGDLNAEIINGLPNGAPPAEGDQELGLDELAIEVLVPRDIHDSIFSRWARPIRKCRSVPPARLNEEPLPDQIHILIAEFEKDGFLNWNTYDRWRRTQTGSRLGE